MQTSHEARRHGRLQRGIASVAFTGLLVLAMMLGLAYANRHLLVEQRAVTNQVLAGQGFEAAEAGLAWATARLNDPRAIDEDCEAAAAPSASSFRSRFLRLDDATGHFVPVTRLDGAAELPLEAACLRAADSWRCHCPASGPAWLAPASGLASTPGFVVRFESAGAPGLVRVVSRGCSHPEGSCKANGPGDSDSAQLQVLLGWLPGLRTPPLAALTVRNELRDEGALDLADSSTTTAALAIQAGGAVHAPRVRWHSPSGAPLASALVSDDPALARRPADRWFPAYFGLDAPSWAAQPAVRHVSCNGDCGPAIRQAVDGDAGPSLVHVAGGALIQGPLQLGSAERPIALVVTGALELSGAVSIEGLVHGGSVTWHAGAIDAAPPGINDADSSAGSGTQAVRARIRGALLCASDYHGTGAPLIIHDLGVLQRLRLHAGTFARVAGSWRDF